MNPVQSMKWLIRRELWENKGSMVWTPLVIGLVLFVFAAGTAIWKVQMGDLMEFGVHVNGKQVDLANMMAALTQQQRESAARGLANSYLAVSAPLFLMLPAVVFFYCLGALYEERRDRSILFWKSLPLSDGATVASKVATALIVAPAIVVVVATITSLAMLFVVATLAAFYGVNLFGLLLTSWQTYLTPFQLMALLPIYMLWALPTVGYLLLVSSWAKSKVFLWAVGTPLIIAAIIKWTDYLAGGRGLKAEWFMEHVVGAGLGGLIPGVWLFTAKLPKERLVHVGDNMVDMARVVEHSYLSLASPAPWIGAAAGVLMLYVAMRLRRYRDEA